MKRLGFLFCFLIVTIVPDVKAQPPERCPCFNAMFAAGACTAIIGDDGHLQFNEYSIDGYVLNCYSADRTSVWSFAVYTTVDPLTRNCSAITSHNSSGPPANAFREDGIPQAEFEACKEDLNVAALLLTD